MAEFLVDYLRQTVEKHPEKVAITHGGINQTYKQLWHNVCQISSFLLRDGLAVKERVALLLENSPEFIASYYGIQRAGGVVVALNTAAKARDVINWIEHSGAVRLLIDSSYPEFGAIRDKLCQNVKMIVKTSDSALSTDNYTTWSDVIGSLAGNPTDGVSLLPDDLASLIYTSGTTGKPKGVMLSHRNLASNVSSVISYLGLKSSDSCVNVLPFYYSFGNSVLHTHIAVGGRLILENSFVYPHVIMSRITEYGATGFYGVPSTYALLLSRTQLSKYDLSTLRYMAQAGGPLAPAKIQQLTDALPHVSFFVMYGQTEATARLTYLPPSKLQDKLGSVGIPIPGVQIRICNEAGKPVENGVKGEICASGPNIMLGYWQNQDETDKVLQKGWLQTGDLARLDDDRYIYIEGRLSDMIKSGAHRISPKDIEEVILELDGVEEVAVVGIPDDILGQVIKAIVVKTPGCDVDPVSIQAYCRRQLPLYKVPKSIEFSSSLPKTASGKVKRFLLAGQG